MNPQALRRLVSIANANPELNAYLSQADSAANINIRLATPQELRQLGAGAFFSYDLKLQDNDGKMSIALDPAWLVGDNALIASGGVNRANVAGMVTHELDHYMRVEQFRATDDLADPNKVFPNLSATERFEMYASQRMQVEVMGWYESLQAQRFERTGSVAGALSTGQLMSVGLVERELYALDQRGRAMGLQGESLERYVAEGGARILSSSNSPYWDSYVRAMQAATPGIDFTAVRQQMAYALQSPDDVVAWQETIGENGATRTEITYRDGSRQSVVEGLDGHSIVEQFDADGSLAQRVESSTGADGTQTTIIRDASGMEVERVQVRTFDDGSGTETTTYPDGHGVVLTRNADGTVAGSEAFGGNPHSFTAYLEGAGADLSTAQQQGIANQLDSLNLGNTDELSFITLSSGSTLIQNADGDVVGEIQQGADGQTRVSATRSMGSPADISSRVRSAQVGLNFTVPLYAGGGVSARVREAFAQKEKAQDDLEAARREAVFRARQAYAAVENGQAQIQALRSAVRSSQSALDANQVGYRIGTRINIDVLNAEQQLYAARRDLYRARADVLVQSLRLKAANATLSVSDIYSLNQQLEPNATDISTAR